MNERVAIDLCLPFPGDGAWPRDSLPMVCYSIFSMRIQLVSLGYSRALYEKNAESELQFGEPAFCQLRWDNLRHLWEKELPEKLVFTRVSAIERMTALDNATKSQLRWASANPGYISVLFTVKSPVADDETLWQACSFHRDMEYAIPVRK